MDSGGDFILGVRMRIDDEGKVFWLCSQVQGCCAKAFSAVGVSLPPLLTLEPDGKPIERSGGGQADWKLETGGWRRDSRSQKSEVRGQGESR